MGVAIGVLIVPVLIVLVFSVMAALAFAIYKAAYRRKINKRLAEGREADIKPMMSPVKFVVIMLLSIIGGIILLWGLLLFMLSGRFTSPNKVADNYILAYDLLDESPFSGYRTGDEIKGYTDYVTENENGTIRIHVYVINEPFGNMFPPVLMAAEYLGDRSVYTAEFSETYGDGFRNSTSTEYRDQEEENSAVLHVYTNKNGYDGRIKAEYRIWYDNIDHTAEDRPECDESCEAVFQIDENGRVSF